MSATCRDNPVTTFRAREGKEELARINRLTGLQFESLPRSLLRAPAEPEAGPRTELTEGRVVAFRRAASASG
jgi:hypothetical protein